MAFQQHQRAVLSRLQKKIPEAVMSNALLRLKQDMADRETDEFTGVYLPLAFLIHQRISAHEALQAKMAAMLGVPPMAAPFIIGLTGSVSVGKSTSAQFLQNALAAWPEHSDVALITSDGFLFPNAELEQRGILERKGFPESFDGNGLVAFLRRLKSGGKAVTAPVYSHITYDILPDQGLVIQNPHIVIVEGINVLQPHLVDGSGDHVFASDFFDYSIYLHADETLIKKWFAKRFLVMTEAAINDPKSFYARFAPLTAEQRLAVVDFVWATINGRNLNDHILPTRQRADLILHKGPDHSITHFEMR